MGLRKGSAKCKPIAMGKKSNFELILDVSNLMTYESHDEKRPASCREDRKKHDERGGKQNSIVAVGTEVVWKQLTTLIGGRRRDSLLGSQRATVNEINLLKIN